LYSHPLLVPRMIIYDPVPTISTPLDTWLSSGVRAIDHCIEGICSNRSNLINDSYAIQALKLLFQNLRRTKYCPTDLEARQLCQYAVWMSMASFSHHGMAMGVSHAIGHVLGGSFDVPHGVTSCITIPGALRYNYEFTADRQQ